MATNDPDDRTHEDDATARQRAAGERRGEIIPGKGFDAGGGYGGAGNENLYDPENSYGGQSGLGGSTMRGAYAGEPYGRPGDADAPPDSLDARADAPDRDTGAGSGLRDHADQSSDAGGAGSGKPFTGREGEFDSDSHLGGERRDPERY